MNGRHFLVSLFLAVVITTPAFAVSCPSGWTVNGATCFKEITTTGASSFIVPTNWNNSNNIEIAIGSGATGGQDTSGTKSGGGGGGAYAATVNLSLTPGNTVFIQVPASSTVPGTNGAVAWLNSTANAAPTLSSQGVLAPGGNSTTSETGGLGGLCSTAIFNGFCSSGGNGGNGASASPSNQEGGGGASGGGANGQTGGAGGNGVNTSPFNSGGGGGCGEGGQGAGQNGGSGTGAGGVAGTNGAPGGNGGNGTSGAAGNGSSGVDLCGSGGGGINASAAHPSGAGSNFGGGSGSGGNAMGASGQGVIYVQYTPIGTSNSLIILPTQIPFNFQPANDNVAIREDFKMDIAV